MSAPTRRHGFTLLEVMIALGILVVSLLVLLETQATAIQATQEADRILVATQLAQEKLAEVRMRVEQEGFSQDDVYEDGDFSDLGDDAMNLEFDDLEDYQFEYLVTPVDLEALSDLTAVSSNLMAKFGPQTTADGAPPQIPDLSAFGVSPEMVTTALDPFVREVRVRVWWGEDPDEAEELGNEVVITTHMINPHGQMMFGGGGGTGGAGDGGTGGRPNAPGGGAGGRGPGGGPGGGRGLGGGRGGLGGGGLGGGGI